MRNVHDIAIELEGILCKKFGIPERPRGTIFDADAIETYMFYDDIVLALSLFGKRITVISSTGYMSTKVST